MEGLLDIQLRLADDMEVWLRLVYGLRHER